jgi:biopolymer transport protein ExbD
MATKTKPPEALSVIMPSSVSAKAVELNDQVMVILNEEGKVFLSFSEPERKEAVAEEVAKLKGVPMSAADVKKAGKVEFFGSPLAQLPSYVNLPKESLNGELLPGIPAVDSANNELTLWMTAVNNIFRGDKMNLLVKGDNAAKYPAFKQVLEAFKKNDFLKFSIVTNSEGIPEDSELAKARKKGAAAAE